MQARKKKKKVEIAKDCFDENPPNCTAVDIPLFPMIVCEPPGTSIVMCGQQLTEETTKQEVFVCCQSFLTLDQMIGPVPPDF